MAAPTPADMSTCDPKCKCPSGSYANQAYACDDPCAGQNANGNCTFDCQNGCDCPGRDPGVYQIRVTGTGTDVSVLNLDTCYAIIVESYFDESGDLYGKDIYQSIQPSQQVGEGSGFSEVQPFSQEEGPVCTDEGVCVYWPNISSRRVTLLASYCVGEPNRRAGTVSGAVGYHLTRNGELVSYKTRIGPEILWAGCDLVTSVVNYDIQYIGQGTIADFYQSPSYIGSSLDMAIIDSSEVL